MTWSSLFDMSTMGHRHLLFAYAAVLIIQGGYAGWIAWNWLRTKDPRH
jgi:drug/metabolite transporter superfamily protein YnfA